MANVTSYYAASGTSYRDCAFLAQRYDEEAGYHPFESECWVVTIAPGAGQDVELQLQYGTTAWLTGLWRSPSGTVYVSCADGSIRKNPNPRALPQGWDKAPIDATLLGVWGIDDAFVLTWGTRGQGSAVFRWDGKRWTELGAPPFGIRAVHGVAPDLVYAVGTDGGIARWDGAAWQVAKSPTREILSSVFVAGPGEIYAAGSQGSVLEGSASGWGKIGEGPGLPGPLAAIARFKGELWLGAGQFGLWRRVGTTSQFELVKPNVHAVSFDARQSLLIACDDVIVSTEDGKAFFAAGRGYVAKKRGAAPLGENM